MAPDNTQPARQRVRTSLHASTRPTPRRPRYPHLHTYVIQVTQAASSRSTPQRSQMNARVTHAHTSHTQVTACVPQTIHPHAATRCTVGCQAPPIALPYCMHTIQGGGGVVPAAGNTPQLTPYSVRLAHTQHANAHRTCTLQRCARLIASSRLLDALYHQWQPQRAHSHTHSCPDASHAAPTIHRATAGMAPPTQLQHPTAHLLHVS